VGFVSIFALVLFAALTAVEVKRRHNHSKSKKMNWLIWWVYESQRKRVITHFGPFGDAETKKMKKTER